MYPARKMEAEEIKTYGMEFFNRLHHYRVSTRETEEANRFSTGVIFITIPRMQADGPSAKILHNLQI
jgi:hypothetical protein